MQKNKKSSQNRKRTIGHNTPFAIKEAYVKLRTNLMFCMTKDNQRACKTFVITSAKPAEGKSVTAANLAISFAMLRKNVILIDADMRKPTQQRIWGIDSLAGLCDFLAKIHRLELSRVKGLPLWIVCSGTNPPNPSELLSSDRMKQFVEKCAKIYDYVIIDAPPVNMVADAQIISGYVDGVVLVARSGDTTTDELNMAVNTIRRSDGNICGVILNGMNLKAANRSYKYKYSKKYGYSYSYTE